MDSNSPVRINFPESIQFSVSNRSTLEQTNIKHCKIRCRFQLNIGHGTAEFTVEFNSTLDQRGLSTALSVCSRITPHLFNIIVIIIFFFFFFWHSKIALLFSRSCYFRLQFLMPTFFRSSSTDSRHLSLCFPTRRVPSGLNRVSFLQGFSSCILKRCPSHLNLPI